MSAAQDRTRETLPDIPGEAVTAGDTDQVSAVREVAARPADASPLVEAAGATAVGPGRRVNEDAFAAWPDLGLCVVADGMGGRPAGEIAARLAVAEIHSLFEAGDPDRTPPMALDVTRGLAAGILVRAVEHANTAVYSTGLRNVDWKGMGAAVAALLTAGPRVVVAHVGDVRVYRFRGGGLERLTEDHSQGALYSQWRGDAADPEILRQQQRVLTQAVGAAPTVRVTVRVETIAAGDVFLLCSDGVWGGLTHDVMARAITEATGRREAGGLRAAAAALVERAQQAGGTDDTTAVLVRPLAEGRPGDTRSPIVTGSGRTWPKTDSERRRAAVSGSEPR